MENEIQLIIFDDEELTQTLIESYIKDSDIKFKILKFSQYEDGLIPNDNAEKIIIVNINKTIAKNLEKLSKIAHNKNNNLITISYDKSADIQVKAMRAGAEEFLCKPIVKIEFLNTIQKIIKNKNKNKDKKMTSKIYSVVSADHGVGKTFFAINLSYELAKLSKERVLLVDFNNSLTDVFQLLNMNVKYTTTQYINLLTEQNASKLLGKLVQYNGSQLYILGTGIASNSENDIDAESVNRFFSIVKKYFRYIIIDNDSSLHELDKVIKMQSDYVYIIMDSSKSMADKVRVQHLDLRLESKYTRVILNKYNAKKDEKILEELEHIIGRPIFMKITKNFIAASSALDKSSALSDVSPDIETVKEYKNLAKIMIEQDGQ